jgi:hypothetical protein
VFSYIPLVDRSRIELLLHACKAHVLPLSLTAQIVVRQERLELSILAALASKTSVYTIPPLTHYTFMSTFVPLVASTAL